jgi:hypothetical protein
MAAITQLQEQQLLALPQLGAQTAPPPRLADNPYDYCTKCVKQYIDAILKCEGDFWNDHGDFNKWSACEAGAVIEWELCIGGCAGGFDPETFPPPTRDDGGTFRNPLTNRPINTDTGKTM